MRFSYMLREKILPEKFLSAAKKTFKRRKTEFLVKLKNEAVTIEWMQILWTEFLRSPVWRQVGAGQNT